MKQINDIIICNSLDCLFKILTISTQITCFLYSEWNHIAQISPLRTQLNVKLINLGLFVWFKHRGAQIIPYNWLLSTQSNLNALIQPSTKI